MSKGIRLPKSGGRNSRRRGMGARELVLYRRGWGAAYVRARPLLAGGVGAERAGKPGRNRLPDSIGLSPGACGSVRARGGTCAWRLGTECRGAQRRPNRFVAGPPRDKGAACAGRGVIGVTSTPSGFMRGLGGRNRGFAGHELLATHDEASGLGGEVQEGGRHGDFRASRRGDLRSLLRSLAQMGGDEGQIKRADLRAERKKG